MTDRFWRNLLQTSVERGREACSVVVTLSHCAGIGPVCSVDGLPHCLDFEPAGYRHLPAPSGSSDDAAEIAAGEVRILIREPSAPTLPKVVSGLRLDAVVLIEREDNAQSFEWIICYEFPGVITLTPSL